MTSFLDEEHAASALGELRSDYGPARSRTDHHDVRFVRSCRSARPGIEE
jgi:hypothetical protein